MRKLYFWTVKRGYMRQSGSAIRLFSRIGRGKERNILDLRKRYTSLGTSHSPVSQLRITKFL